MMSKAAKQKTPDVISDNDSKTKTRLKLYPTFQAKLRISQPDDIYEQEADMIADQIMRMPSDQVRSECSSCQKNNDEEMKIHRKIIFENNFETSDEITNEISGMRDNGSPLDVSTRNIMESKFGFDFGKVRIHNDEEATKSVNARAYTIGNDIVFGRGEYSPSTTSGQHLLAHELVHTIQQRSTDHTRYIFRDVGNVSVTNELTPKQMLDKYTSFWFGLDVDGLSNELISRLPSDSTFVNDLFDLAPVQLFRISTTMASKLDNNQLTKIVADSVGRKVLWRIIEQMALSPGLEEDKEKLIFTVSPEHKRLKQEPWSNTKEVKVGLAATGAKMQSISSWWASGLPQFDEYSVIIDAMPPGLTPETFLLDMANDLNKSVDDYWFDAINEFKRTTAHDPSIGDIYHIDIKGPDNGSVMLVEQASDHFIFQTVSTVQDGTHPEYGSREFGFEKNDDGSVRFYTRGASRSSMLPGTELIGRPIQKVGWTRLVTGIGKTIENKGGKVRSGSIHGWRSQP